MTRGRTPRASVGWVAPDALVLRSRRPSGPQTKRLFSAEVGNSGSRTYRTAEPKIPSLRETNSRCGLTRAISRTKGSGTCRSFILPRASIASAATVSAFPFGRATGCGRLSPRRLHQIGPLRARVRARNVAVAARRKTSRGSSFVPLSAPGNRNFKCRKSQTRHFVRFSARTQSTALICSTACSWLTQFRHAAVHDRCQKLAVNRSTPREHARQAPKTRIACRGSSADSGSHGDKLPGAVPNFNSTTQRHVASNEFPQTGSWIRSCPGPDRS